jgi:hypothetical protein
VREEEEEESGEETGEGGRQRVVANKQRSHRVQVDNDCTDALMQPGVTQNFGMQSMADSITAARTR